MNAILATYFSDSLFKENTRTKALVLGILLAAAGVLLVLQSFFYASSPLVLLRAGAQIWGQALGSMLQTLAVWAVVLGVVFAVRSATQPTALYGTDFWKAILTGFPLGLILPFLLVLAAGLLIYLPLGLLSLPVAELFPYATLQFAFLAGTYLVLLWIAAGMPLLLAALYQQRKWYDKFLAVLLALLLTLNVLQAGLGALQILLEDSPWQTRNPAFFLAVLGALLMSIALVVWRLERRPGLAMVYASAGIYIASVVTGILSERLFHWGELPAALVALLAPLLYVRVASWILRRDGTAAAGLAAGFAGLLAGLFLIRLLHLAITGQSLVSLLYGILLLMIVGFIAGYFLGRLLTRLLARRFQLLPALARLMESGLTAGIMAGMFIGGFLGR